ncbi:hypothetical protein V6N13_017773 [Hibiscus sabdariffa]
MDNGYPVKWGTLTPTPFFLRIAPTSVLPRAFPCFSPPNKSPLCPFTSLLLLPKEPIFVLPFNNGSIKVLSCFLLRYSLNLCRRCFPPPCGGAVSLRRLHHSNSQHGGLPCLTFVSSGSKASKPEGKCCSGLKTVLKSGPECLCEAFKSSASFGITLNVTKAMALPAACKVSAPSATSCALSPAGAPGMAPSAGAPGTFSGGATAVAPAPAPGSSGAPVVTVSIGSLISGLVIMLMCVY